jgi:hypothetical protein
MEAPLAGGRRQVLHMVLEVERHQLEATVVLINEFTVRASSCCTTRRLPLARCVAAGRLGCSCSTAAHRPA